MTIAKLDILTAGLLGSSVGITSPYAVVKELLDNAIDAGADSVEIAISQNTLDSIRVRDNGTGINPDDLGMIGRAEHTSKVSAIDELSIGRIQTLGFRGLAVSNINSIGTVQIITKTAEEPVASKVQLASTGGIGKTFSPVSAPTGTTVQVTDLFHNMPPRKQFLLQASRKNMGKIKELLVAYVFANADLRIILKVRGDEKLGCKLGQTKNRSVKQAVLELFGSTVVAGGETYRFAETKSPSTSFTLIAFLPIASIDPKTIRGRGAFISVNGRPLCATDGIGQALTAVFKAKIRQSWQLRGLASVPQPLLVLDITCPYSMYDVNVAPMKDDLLFADPDVLLRGFEELCGAVYDECTILKGCDSMIVNEIVQDRNRELHHVDSEHRQKLVSAHVQTASKVNMLRTNSNVTDEGTEQHIAEFMLPAKGLMCKENYWTDELRFSEAYTKKNLRGAERSFQATRPEFEIATDETATPGALMTNQEACIRFIDTGECQPRMPLSIVSDSMLNVLASTNAASSDVSGHGDAPRLSDLNGTGWSIQNGINQDAIQMPTQGVAITQSSPSQPSSPLIGGQRPEEQQAMDAPQRPIVSTVPLADLTREDQGFRPAFDILRSSVGPQPLPSNSSDSSDYMLATVERHPAQALRNTKRRSLDRNGIREIESEAVPSMPMRLNRRTFTCSGSPRVPERRPVKHHDKHEVTNGIEYIQELLQCDGSGEPPGGNRTGRAKSIRGGASLVEKTTHNQPPSKKHCVNRLGIQQIMMPEFDFSISGDVEDGEFLPLEYIPETMATWRRILTLDVGLCDVGISASLLQTLDTYIQTGELASTMSSLGWLEVAELEARVERIRQGILPTEMRQD